MVITGGQWNEVVNAFVIMALLVWVCAINWNRWVESIEFRIRRELRRRRIRAIRAMRA